jgi:hypothetical protein
MATPLSSHAVFSQPCHLLSALHLSNGSASFPFHVQKTHNNLLCVPLNLVGGDHFDHLCKQHGWKATAKPKAPKGETIPLYQILSMADCWRPRDLSRDMVNSDRHGATNYLFGASDQEHAQQLVDILTGLLASDIRATPILLQNVNEQKKSLFQFFWLASMTRPLLLPLKTAQGAWREIHGGGNVRLFVDWSYDLMVDIDYLSKIDWGERAAVVLLGHPEPNIPQRQNSVPEVLILRQSTGSLSFSDLITVANLQVGTPHILELQPQRGQRAPLQFSVQVRLEEGNSGSALADRISKLNDEINAKSAIRDQLLRRRADSSYDQGMPQEPLYLYLDDSEMPFALQRLLVEWTDQAEDLRALQYQRLTTNEWPEGVRDYYGANDIHVVTTPLALGQSGPHDLGVRLCEYPPRGRYVSFKLLPEWEHFGLRLFAPQDRHIRLYPEFQPSEVAASKLAQAVLENDASGKERSPQEWAALLVPTQSGRICPILLRIKNFQPLFESFQWNCRFDFMAVATNTDEQIVNRGQKIVQEQVKQIASDSTKSILQEAMATINLQEQAMLADLQRIEQEIADRKKQIISHQQTVKQLSFPVRYLDRLLTNVSAWSDELLQRLSNLMQEGKQTADKINRVTELKTDLAIQRREIEQAMQAMRKDSGSSNGSQNLS